MSRIPGEEKKRTVRFGFADAIITAALIITAFVILVGIFSSKPPVECVLEVTLTEKQSEFYRNNPVALEEGAEVRYFDGGEKIGVLSAGYEPGGETLQILVKVEQNEKNAWKCGDRISLTVGNMIVCDALITDVRKDG